jgi:pilus assembly protein Flp/PilA
MFIVERILMTVAMLRDRHEDSEVGASMVEYALLVAGMALVVVAAVAAFGTKITAIIASIDIPT